ncbi:MAG: hypothetical protein M1839_002278 [Geoglossum umbratile]|nr:MAG: hypothetical protein M1839_002278 [Geoglossum umbratile]
MFRNEMAIVQFASIKLFKPHLRGRKKVTPRKKRVSVGVPNGDNGEPSTPPAKNRRTPAVTPSGRSIPETMEDLDDKDKMLLDMKGQGKTWPEIREAFKNFGITTGASTLPDPYSRPTAKLVEWKTGDVDIFLAVKSTIEVEFLEAKKAMEAKFVQRSGARLALLWRSKKKLKDITAKSSSRASSNGGPSKTTGSMGLVCVVQAAINEESGEDEGA